MAPFWIPGLEDMVVEVCVAALLQCSVVDLEVVGLLLYALYFFSFFARQGLYAKAVAYPSISDKREAYYMFADK